MRPRYIELPYHFRYRQTPQQTYRYEINAGYGNSMDDNVGLVLVAFTVLH